MGKTSRDRTLVIFGCGYLGTSVARESVARGWDVTALTRNQRTAAQLEKIGVTKVVTGTLDGDSWNSRIPNHADFVLNCVGTAGGGEDGYRKSYCEGQKSILRWLARGGVGTFVYTSSTSVYAQGKGVTVFEDDQAEPINWRGRIICEAENILTRRSNETSVARLFILRLAGLYGPDRHRFLDECINSDADLRDRADSYLNLIHRDDATRAILAAFDAPEGVVSNLFNLSDGAPHRKSEIAAWVAERVNIDRCTKPGERETPRKSVREVSDRRINSDKIRKLLGWKPEYPSFREGFAEIIRDMKKTEKTPGAV